jgi:hypothetical protein
MAKPFAAHYVCMTRRTIDSGSDGDRRILAQFAEQGHSFRNQYELDETADQSEPASKRTPLTRFIRALSYDILVAQRSPSRMSVCTYMPLNTRAQSRPGSTPPRPPSTAPGLPQTRLPRAPSTRPCARSSAA